MLRLFALLLLFATTPVQAAWQRASTEHFVIYADASPDWVSDYARDMERFDLLARTVFNLQDRSAGMKLTIFVVGTTSDVQRIHGVPGANVGGFYVPGFGGAIAVVPRATQGAQTSDVVLRHEYAHHLMMQYFAGSYPAWYIEGFADFLSTATFDDGKATLGQPPPNRWLAIRGGARIGLKRLLALGGDLNRSETRALYAEGWMFTHYLMTDTARRAQLSRYLDLIAEGRTSIAAAGEAFGDLNALERAFASYSRQSRLSYFPIAKSFTYAGPLETTALDDGERRTVTERIAVMRGIRPQDRTRLVSEIADAAARAPQSASTWTLLAQAELQAQNLAAAEAAADKALAIQPNLSRALLWKGMAIVGRLRAANDRDAAKWRAARGYIIRANRADPGDALPLYQNYLTYRYTGQEPNQTARDGLLLAHQLLPQQRGIRFTLVRDLAERGESEAAIALLRPIANSPHGKRAAANAARQIARIEAAKAAGQKAALPEAAEPPPEAEGGDDD